MMGFQTAPAQLFDDFCLADYVPADHLLRRIDRFLDLGSVRLALKPFYSSIGRPSADPEPMMRMLSVGYASASAPSGGYARRSISTSPTAGSAGLVSMARCRIMPPSRATVMAASARATSCIICSRP
jgi:hypothetical protein